MIKDAEELASLSEMPSLWEPAFRPGAEDHSSWRRETEVAAEMEYAARGRGGGHVVPHHHCRGSASALPHGRASRAAIPDQGFVVCDFGVILAGYCSDLTRTVHVGRPTRRLGGFTKP